MSPTQFPKDVKSFFKKITGKDVVAIVVSNNTRLHTFHKKADVESFTSLQKSEDVDIETVWFKQDAEELVNLLKKALGNNLFAALACEKESDEDLPSAFVLNVAETASGIGQVISSLKCENSAHKYKGFISLNTFQAIPAT